MRAQARAHAAHCTATPGGTSASAGLPGPVDPRGVRACDASHAMIYTGRNAQVSRDPSSPTGLEVRTSTARAGSRSEMYVRRAACTHLRKLTVDPCRSPTRSAADYGWNAARAC